MRDVTPGYQDRRHTMQLRDRTASAFLYLGEKLRSFSPGRAPGVASPASVPTGAETPETREALLRVIEAEIVPRLLLAHRAGETRPPAARPRPSAPSPDDRNRFLALVLHDTAFATRQFVQELLQRGVSQEALFLDLLSHTACRLGELWDEDRCDFADVAIGLCRLHEVLREQSVVHAPSPKSAAAESPRILLTNACADKHVFGVVMVAEFFRRSGWRVCSEPGAFPGQLAGILARDRFDVLGLSAACDAMVDEVANEIEMLRKASRNTGIRVLVGGRMFLDSPELVSRVGADGSAEDARRAPVVGRGLLARPRVQDG